MTLIKNITEGLLFVETQEGLKGLKPEETMVVEECLNCATLIEAGFLATVAEGSEEEVENAEQEGEETVVEGSEEGENTEQEVEATVVDGSEEVSEEAEQEGEETVVEGSEEGENAEQDQKEEIKDEVVKTKKTQAKKNK